MTKERQRFIDNLLKCSWQQRQLLTFSQSFSVICRMKKFLLSAIVAISVLFASAQNDEYYMFVGTYTSPGKSEGIYVYKFNTSTGESVPVSSIATQNPSYLSISPNEKYVYAVHEVDSKVPGGGQVSSFTFNKTDGKLSLVNSQSSGGNNPCYVQVDNTGRWVFAGNYSSGTLSVYSVNNDGSLGSPNTIQHAGTGPDKQRQEGPHVHCTVISPDNKWLYVPDLGIDKVMIYKFDDKTGKLTNNAKDGFVAAEPGGGPRHITFAPNKKYAYLIQELAGQVAAYQYKKGDLKLIQRISTIDSTKKGTPGSADIHVSPDGKFLYGSNRGNLNDLVWYNIDPSNGKLAVAGHQSTLGRTPRNFNIDPSGNYLLVANQGSNEIVVFKRNKSTGALTDTGKRIPVGQPVCIKWMKIN